MFTRFVAAVAVMFSVGILVSLPSAPAKAGDDSGSGSDYYAGLSCGRLWYERNRIYARYGYCFKSDRAIATFGRGCFAPYGRVPSHQRRVINRIQRIERAKGC
ncbi:MAG: YARHG domain-containing protein [Hyphomicrobiaceae bacterium]|nr:YARHG domain-containing protein [Hyphomicrobiaceae bacterium]